MKITTRLDVIEINGVERYVNDVLKILAKLPVDDLVNYLEGPKFFSRRDYATVLKNVMRDEVWKFKLVSRVAEKGLAHDFYSRLDYFEDSPVTVLENLFTKMVKIQPELIDYFLEDMWLFALQVVTGKNNELLALVKKGEKATTSKIVLAQLFPKLTSLFRDELGDIDGVLLSEFTRKGLNSATLRELRQMGEHFDVNLPTSITKQDIFDGIIKILPDVAKAKDIPAITEDLEDMTVAELKAFVEKYKLEVSVELKKADVGDLLVAGYVNKEANKVNDEVAFNLPERVDAAPDISDENPKFIRLSERVKELEAQLADQPKEVEKVVVKEVVKKVGDEAALKKEQTRVEKLEEELAKAKEQLAEQPKEVEKVVVKEVPGRTVIRTVVSKKELLRQKEKYEAIIAEQEKERALLISRTDEQDEILAKYAEVKEALARKEAELDEELSRGEERVTEPELVSEPRETYDYRSLDSVHAKMDRLVDKMHDLQLEMVRSENRRLERELQNRDRHVTQVEEETDEVEDDKSDTEVNLYFDSNLAKRMAASAEGKPAKRRRKKKRRRGRWFWWTLLIIILLAIAVFVGGWALVNYGVAPFTYGPAWIVDPSNLVITFLHGITHTVFSTVVGWWQVVVGWWQTFIGWFS